MSDLLSTIQAERVGRTLVISEPDCGLLALIVLDDLTLGPGAGGIRTKSYPNESEALRDAARLARAMTIKCALAGLDAGGAKGVVLDHPGLDRTRAFLRLGEAIEDLRGLFHTAGDLGTTAADLRLMASRTRYVHPEEDLTVATGRGLLRSMEAVARHAGRDGVRGLKVAIQGAGAIGAAAARALVDAGAVVTIADLDRPRAAYVAQQTGAQVGDPESILELEVDVIAPCAIGGVITRALVPRIKAFAVCGAANNALADDSVAEALRAARILHVPDMIASAGAVIVGISRAVMGESDPTPLIDALGDTTTQVLAEAKASGRPPLEVAQDRAKARIRERRLAALRAGSVTRT